MTQELKKVWITWEDHRRSRELAKALNAEYAPLLFKGERIIRYPILTIRTIYFLIKFRPRIAYCQNPSIVLNSLLCFLKPLFGYKLIVDRHSNFKFSTKHRKEIKWKIFNFLSKYTIKKSDLIIVTNDFLKNYIDENGGKGIVLQDKLPELDLAQPKKLLGENNFVFISTFSDDEPIEEVLEAARLAGDGIHVYITGGYKKYKNIAALMDNKPANVTLTGFLSELDYQSLLKSADVIIVITDQEHTLTCGAYEAVSFEKPMILGNTQAIKDYFSKGALYTDSSAANLSACMLQAIENIEVLQEAVTLLKPELIKNWNERFKILTEIQKS